MEQIDYAVVIRTIGTAGEKYKNLLKSIDNLQPKPKEVIVVLPEGYEIPKNKLGYEKFIFSKKGMISQRIYGVSQTNCKYILFCDDDISFGSDYINKLYEPIKNNLADATVGPLLEFFPPRGAQSIVSMLLTGAVPMLFKKKYYTKILRGSGWSYNRINLNNCKKYYNTQSAAWTNFFIKKEVMMSLKFEDEMWLEKFGYAALDDQTMFYKMYKMGYKTLVVSEAIYIHQDGKTSVKELNLEPIYAKGFNHYIFWHRFIYNLHEDKLNKLLDKLSFKYWYIANVVYITIRKDGNFKKAFINGVKDAKKYIDTDEYKNLPKIKG